MQNTRTRLFILLGLSAGLSAIASGASAQPQQKVAPLAPGASAAKALEYDEDVETARAASQRGAPLRAKLKPFIQADARTKPLVAAFKEAMKITDKRARKLKLDALGPQVLAIRNDAVAKSKIDPVELQKEVAASTIKATVRPRPAQAPLPKKETVSISSWPGTWSHKSGCDDVEDKWDFDGSLVNIHAASTPIDDDCDNINAGRKATVDVPPGGMTRVDIQGSAVVDLSTAAASIGFYGKAVAHWGVKIVSPQGITLSKVQVGGQQVDIPAASCKFKTIDAVNSWPNPIPWDMSNFEDNVQAGDENSTCSFNLPPGLNKLEVIMYAGGRADADVAGIAEMDAKLTPKSAKLTFSRP